MSQAGTACPENGLALSEPVLNFHVVPQEVPDVAAHTAESACFVQNVNRESGFAGQAGRVKEPSLL